MDYIDNILDTIKLPIYAIVVFLIQGSYLLALFGIIWIDPVHINKLNIFAQIFVCGFLIYRFHPFRSHELRKYDSRIIFWSALLLLSNLGITQYFTYFMHDVKIATTKLNKVLNKE